ncbi:HGxxPAAW family protein [Angustibacter peucedani]
MSEHGHSSHGNTVAAWTCVGLLMVSALLLCLAVVLTSVLVAVIGGVVGVAGLVAGKVLSLAGYGSVTPADEREPHGIR